MPQTPMLPCQCQWGREAETAELCVGSRKAKPAARQCTHPCGQSALPLGAVGAGAAGRASSAPRARRAAQPEESKGISGLWSRPSLPTPGPHPTPAAPAPRPAGTWPCRPAGARRRRCPRRCWTTLWPCPGRGPAAAAARAGCRCPAGARRCSATP